MPQSSLYPLLCQNSIHGSHVLLRNEYMNEWARGDERTKCTEKRILALKTIINVMLMTVTRKQLYFVLFSKYIIYIRYLIHSTTPWSRNTIPHFIDDKTEVKQHTRGHTVFLIREVVMVWTQTCFSLKFIFLLLNFPRLWKGSLLARTCYGKTNTEIPIMGMGRCSPSHQCSANQKGANENIHRTKHRSFKWMAVVAHIFCLSNTNLHSTVSQVTRGRELESGMTGTLRKLIVSRSCQLYRMSPSCQPQQGWWLAHFHTSLSFNSL